MKNFFRKVGFGLGPNDEIPSNALIWATSQFDKVPEILWQKNVLSVDEMAEIHGEFSYLENSLIDRKFKSAEDYENAQRSLYDEYQLEGSENNELSIRHYNAIYGQQPVFERMLHFWGNHFCITGKDNLRSFATGPYHRDVLRPNMMNTFEELVFQATISHAMQKNLDNWLNCGPNSQDGKWRIQNDKIKNPLNENHARELLELHTISTQAGYTQDDVIEVAKILTGWGLKQNYNGKRGKKVQYGIPLFKNTKWEPGTKIFMGKEYKVKAKDELRELIKDLVNMDICKKFISTKLCKHFVSENPSDQQVNEVVDAWNLSNGSLPEIHKAVIKVAYKHSSNKEEKVVPPEVWMLQVCRIFDFDIASKQKGYVYWEVMENLGHHPYRAAQPNGYSDLSDDWISTEHVLRRMAYSRFLHGYFKGDNNKENFVKTAINKNFDDTSELINMFEHRGQRLKDQEMTDSNTLALICSSPEFLRA